MKKRILLQTRQNPLTKLVLMLVMLLGISGNAWGADITIFGGTVASGWTYKNKAGTNQSVTAGNELYDGGGTYSPKAYTSTTNITISSDQTIKILAKRSSSSMAPSIKVKYSSDNGSSWTQAKEFTSTEITSTSDYAELSVGNIVGSYYIQFEFTYVYIKSIILEDYDPYPTPTDFSLNSYTANSATFSWTAGNSETAWKFAYSTDADFTPSTSTATSITTNPYTLSGLTEGTTYYACICADYGDDNYSDWTDKVSFTPNDEVEISKYDGSTQSYNIPISSTNVANTTALTQTQFIIPSSDLTSIQNRQITKLTFYASRNSVTWGTATFEVYMKETSNTSYSTSTKAFESWGTCVYNNQGLSTNSTNGQMEITLNTPFNYTTGNLMIGFKQLTKGTAPSTTYWYSTTTNTNNAIYSYGTYTGVVTYSPKVTILTVASNTAPIQMGLNGYTTFASTYPLDLTALPSGLKAYKAAVDATNSEVVFTEINQTVPANTGMLLEGTASTTYAIPVADNGTTVENNDFLVNSTGGTFTADGNYTYFGLKKATSASDEVVFATFAPGSVAIPSNKAYLKVLTSSLPAAEARQLTCVFDDGEATGINTVKGAEFMVNGSVFFDLQGRKVAQPTKGLYITNGKKVVIK